MKYITLSTSRLQYNTHGGIASEYTEKILTGKEAYEAVFAAYQRIRKPIQRQIKKLRMISEYHSDIPELQNRLSRYRLSQDEEYTVRLITPVKEWKL